jgi:hypothetical protein
MGKQRKVGFKQRRAIRVIEFVLPHFRRTSASLHSILNLKAARVGPFRAALAAHFVSERR